MFGDESKAELLVEGPINSLIVISSNLTTLVMAELLSLWAL